MCSYRSTTIEKRHQKTQLTIPSKSCLSSKWFIHAQFLFWNEQIKFPVCVAHLVARQWLDPTVLKFPVMLCVKKAQLILIIIKNIVNVCPTSDNHVTLYKYNAMHRPPLSFTESKSIEEARKKDPKRMAIFLVYIKNKFQFFQLDCPLQQMLVILIQYVPASTNLCHCGPPATMLTTSVSLVCHTSLWSDTQLGSTFWWDRSR